MGQSELGNIGFSAEKLEALKAEIGADAVAALKNYIDTCFTSEIAQNRKLIEGRLERFGFPDGVTKIKEHLLSGVNTLTSVDLTGCTQVGSYAFEKCYYVSEMHVEDAVIESLGEGAFSMIGADRVGQGIMTLDFRKSKFTSLGKHAFGGASTEHKLKNMEIWLPNTIKVIDNDAFQNANNLAIHFAGEAPQVMGANVFRGAANVEIYCTWKNAYNYQNGTNWSALNTIIGSNIGEFENGEALPAYDRDGYELSWYSDKAKTTPATTSDGQSAYYCSASNTQSASKVKILNDHATVLIKDGDDNVYDEDHPIPYGVEVTATVSHSTGFEPYIMTLNGSDFTSGSTWTAASGETLTIVVLDTDGEYIPVDPVLGNNSPTVIREVCRKGLALQHWNIGDEVDIPLTSGITATFQLVDATVGRYALANGNGRSNVVFMAKKLYWTAQMNSSGTNAGGWPASKMCTTSMPTYFALLPEDWKQAISEVEIFSATSNSDSTLTTADNHVFIPNTYEIFGSGSYTHSTESTSQFAMYVGSTNADRVKKNTNDQASYWWVRSPDTNNANYFVFVYGDGSVSYGHANVSNGVALCFAI